MSEVFTTDGKFFEGYCLSCHTLNPKVECGGCQKQQIADLEAQLAEAEKKYKECDAIRSSFRIAKMRSDQRAHDAEVKLAERDKVLQKLIRLWNDDYANVYDTPFTREVDKLATERAKEQG